MIAELFLFFLCLGLLRIWWILCQHSDESLPPGPVPVPVFGNIAIMVSTSPLYKTMHTLAEQYGNIFKLRFGPNNCVVLSDAQIIRDAYSRCAKEFAGRPILYSFNLLTRGSTGITFGDYSDEWKQHRKLALHAFHKLVKGKLSTSAQMKITEEVNYLISSLAQYKDGSSTDISKSLALSVMNVICDITFSQRYEVDDAEFQEIINNTNESFETIIVSDPVDFLPFLRVFPNRRLRLIEKVVRNRDRILLKKYHDHLATYDPDNIRDFTDALLHAEITDFQKIKKDSNNNNSLMINEDRVLMTMWEMFTAGYQAIYQTLRWGIAYLVSNPEVQDKIYKEIEREIGGRLPRWEDHSRLKLLEATVLETLRNSSASPMGGPHRVTQDIKFYGYDIPKDTTVFGNFWWVNHDPKNWDNPDEFRPERFLDNEGRLSVPNCFLPFGIGERHCLGENLSKIELFMIFGGLLSKFRLNCPLNKTPDLEPLPGLFRFCKPFEVIISER